MSTATTPAVKGGPVAYLTVDGALRAAEFYARAFAAETAASLPPDEFGPGPWIRAPLTGPKRQSWGGFE